jgi:uncharacterized protein
MKWLKRLAISVVLLLTLFLVALYFMAPGMILHPRKVNWDKKPADFNLPAEEITLVSFDSTVLKGIWVRHDTARQHPVIVLLHGVGNCKERWLPTAAWLWQQGYSLVMMDSRAHGQSGGSCCSYGYYEKKDVSRLLDYLLTRDTALRVGVWGHSLGGAIALQAMAYDKRIQFGIVESTFTHFRNIVYDYQSRLFKVSSRTFADNAIERAARQGGFEPDSIVPCLAAERVQCPVFMAHGTEDERIKFEYGRINFEHLATPNKTFYPVQGAHHNDLSRYGGTEYATAILHFLKQQNLVKSEE